MTKKEVKFVLIWALILAVGIGIIVSVISTITNLLVGWESGWALVANGLEAFFVTGVVAYPIVAIIALIGVHTFLKPPKFMFDQFGGV